MIGKSTAIGLGILAVALAAAPEVARAESPDDILLYKGPDREQKLIEGAKKEGQVVIYAALIQNQAMRPIVDGFSLVPQAVRWP